MPVPSEIWGSVQQTHLQPSREPIAPPSIPSGVQSTPQPEIPVAARTRYERQFHGQCGGKPNLTGIEAAGVFFESGLGKSDLSRIWEETDRDRNGRFGKEEFVQAMWLIESYGTSWRFVAETNLATVGQSPEPFACDTFRSAALYGDDSFVDWLANAASSNCACSAFDILSASRPRTATLPVWVICQPCSFHTSKSRTSPSLAFSISSAASAVSVPSTSPTPSATPAEFPSTPNDRHPSRSGLQRL